MAGTLGDLRGATKCLVCNREHESASASFGVYGFASICPGHPLKLLEVVSMLTELDGKSPLVNAMTLPTLAQVW